jgi:DNA-binding SARP family transcriptional activator/predicted ATPase
MTLRIYLLGQFRLQAGDVPFDLPSRPAQSLLAYLVLNAGVAHRREKLSTLLWPDSAEADARGYLRQALWRIRKCFQNAGYQAEDYLQINELSVTFNERSDYWSDVGQLLIAGEAFSVDGQIATVRLFRGELLPGFYDEWVLAERDRLLAAFHGKMNLLLEALVEARRWDEVLQWGEEWIRLGYSPEPAFRALLRAHAGLGDLGMVSATYQRCLKALDRELGLEPSSETQRLFSAILAGDIVQQSSPVGQGAHANPHAPAIQSGEQRPAFLDVVEPHPVERPVFVARQKELVQLRKAFERALAGQGRVIFMTGEAGSGKTALISEFIQQLSYDQPEVIVASASCNAYTGVGDPYLPFREILGLLSGDVEARWAAGVLSEKHALSLWNVLPATVQALTSTSPDLIDAFVPGLALLERARSFSSGSSDWLSRLEDLVKSKAAVSRALILKSDLHGQYTGSLNAVARQFTLVLVIDDMQWADVGSIGLLFHLSRQISGSRILILGAYRPEEVALGRDEERHPLEPVVHECQRIYGDTMISLDQAASREFVEELLDSEPNQLSLPFRDMLHRQTQGNPLFTIELLRGMQERGDILQDRGGQWLEGPALNWDTLPARVDAVIAERIERIAYPLQIILRTACVEGDVFTAEVLARLTSHGEWEILAMLRDELDRKHHLISAHSIQRIDGQLVSCYRFRHTLYQKYLYRSLDEVERVHMHEQVGNTLEELYRERYESPSLMDIAPQLARHFQEARIVEKAVLYLRLAGERARQVHAYGEAVTHLTTGLKLLATLPETVERSQQELGLLIALGWSWMARGAPRPEAKEALLAARQLCQQTGEKAQLCVVLNNLSIHYYVRGDHQVAKGLGVESLDLASKVNDPLLVALAHWILGFVHFALGEFAVAHSYLMNTISFYDVEKHHRRLLAMQGVDAGLSAKAYDACCLWCLGYPDQAIRLREEALREARLLGHAFSLADVLCYGGCMLDDLRGDGPGLLVYAEEMVRLSQESTFSGWLATGISYRGQALVMLGRVQEGKEQITQGMAMNRSLDVRWGIAINLRMLAELHVNTGQLERGFDLLNEALALVEETKEHFWVSDLYRLYGELQLRQGDQAGAESNLLLSLEIAREQQARSWELRAANSLAWLWVAQGRREEARQLLSGVYEWFTEGFDTPDMLSAKALLSELGSTDTV